jgi:hypothetical protein
VDVDETSVPPLATAHAVLASIGCLREPESRDREIQDRNGLLGGHGVRCIIRK